MKTIFSTFILFLVTATCFAQVHPRKILTRSVEERMLQTDSIRQQKYSIEKHISRNKPYGKLEERTIPLIFHILYSNAEEKIDKAQILSQIDALNQHFKHQTNNIAHIAGIREGFDMHQPEELHIQFCLAATNNINYVSTTITDWGADDAIKQAPLGIEPIEPDKYLNVWVAHLVDSVSGYATMPWAAKELDGIVIDFRFFGSMGTALSPYSEGKNAYTFNG